MIVNRSTMIVTISTLLVIMGFEDFWVNIAYLNFFGFLSDFLGIVFFNFPQYKSLVY